MENEKEKKGASSRYRTVQCNNKAKFYGNLSPLNSRSHEAGVSNGPSSHDCELETVVMGNEAIHEDWSKLATPPGNAAATDVGNGADDTNTWGQP